jgi:hypothetical protein
MVRDGRSLKAEHERILVHEEYPRRLVSDGRTSPPMLRIARVFVDMNSFFHASILRRGYPE